LAKGAGPPGRIRRGGAHAETCAPYRTAPARRAGPWSCHLSGSGVVISCGRRQAPALRFNGNGHGRRGSLHRRAGGDPALQTADLPPKAGRSAERERPAGPSASLRVNGDAALEGPCVGRACLCMRAAALHPPSRTSRQRRAGRQNGNGPAGYVRLRRNMPALQYGNGRRGAETPPYKHGGDGRQRGSAPAQRMIPETAVETGQSDGAVAAVILTASRGGGYHSSEGSRG